ncbi:MAG: hypothetical protein QGF72_01005 [Candidatus Poseidoniaceae archaeon]|jgi:hypothetical protein|nr:hypothetical protein [Candidatus Poseidoniaceae archaeon]
MMGSQLGSLVDPQQGPKKKNIWFGIGGFAFFLSVIWGMVSGGTNDVLETMSTIACCFSIVAFVVGASVASAAAAKAQEAAGNVQIFNPGTLGTTIPPPTTMSTPVSMTDGDSSLSIEKTNWDVDEEISLRFKAPPWPVANKAWVGIVPMPMQSGSEALNDEETVSFLYLQGHTSGKLSFPSPGEGEWSIRLHDADDPAIAKQIAEVDFTVGASNEGAAELPTPPPSMMEAIEEFDEDAVGSALPTPPPSMMEAIEEFDEETINSMADEMGANLQEVIEQHAGDFDAAELKLMSTETFDSKLSALPEPVRMKVQSKLFQKIDAIKLKVDAKKARAAAGVAAGVAAVGVAAAATSSAASKVEEVAEKVEEIAAEPEPEPEPEVIQEPEPVPEPEPEPEAIEEIAPVPEPEPEPEAIEEIAPVEEVAEASIPLHDLIVQLSEARFASERSAIINEMEGASYSFAIEVERVERTVGIGLSEHLKSGRSLTGNIIGDDIEVLVRMPASRNEEMEAVQGASIDVNAVVSDWNSLRKRLDLNHIE